MKNANNFCIIGMEKKKYILFCSHTVDDVACSKNRLTGKYNLETSKMCSC